MQSGDGEMIRITQSFIDLVGRTHDEISAMTLSEFSDMLFERGLVPEVSSSAYAPHKGLLITTSIDFQQDAKQ